jgi:hypothetical protein
LIELTHTNINGNWRAIRQFTGLDIGRCQRGA